MFHVTVVLGAHTGKTGIAYPAGATGPIGARTFIVRVTFDDGSGFVELPLNAVVIH